MKYIIKLVFVLSISIHSGEVLAQAPPPMIERDGLIQIRLQLMI